MYAMYICNVCIYVFMYVCTYVCKKCVRMFMHVSTVSKLT